MTADVTMDPVSIGPVGFESDDVEILFGNQTLRDFSTCFVEFVGAVARFAEEDELRIANEVEERIIIGACTVEPVKCGGKIDLWCWRP